MASRQQENLKGTKRMLTKKLFTKDLWHDSLARRPQHRYGRPFGPWHLCKREDAEKSRGGKRAERGTIHWPRRRCMPTLINVAARTSVHVRTSLKAAREATRHRSQHCQYGGLVIKGMAATGTGYSLFCLFLPKRRTCFDVVLIN